MVPGEEKVYLSSDSICQSDRNADIKNEIYSSDYINSICISVLPNHELKLKIGVPIMLPRNIDKNLGYAVAQGYRFLAWVIILLRLRCCQEVMLGKRFSSLEF